MLDNNYDVASSRLRSLKATLTKSGKLDDYDCAVQMLLQEDHAKVIPEDANVIPRTWFLPHRYVMKKNGLMRLVFDCANRYRGYCLNDTVYQGPKLILKGNPQCQAVHNEDSPIWRGMVFISIYFCTTTMCESDTFQSGETCDHEFHLRG